MESLLQEGKMDMKIGKIEISKKLFITFIVVVVLTILVFILKKAYVIEYDDYKIDDDQEFIYTYQSYDDSKSNIPFINIDTEFVHNLNEQIQKLGEKYANSNTSNNSITYEYNINNNIISLVLIYKNLDKNNKLKFDFTTYVFDLNKGGKALTDDEIIGKFNTTNDKINEEISVQMVKKYDEEINKNILPSNCNYKDCYLKLRGVEKYTDNAHYYIENGWLVVYTTYNTFTDYHEENYFTRDDFKFYITNVLKK